MEEIEKELDEIKSEFKVMEKRIEKLAYEVAKQLGKIKCPMAFTKGSNINTIGLVFQDCKSQLYKEREEPLYCVYNIKNDTSLVQTTLVPISKENIKKNDWVFVTNYENPNFAYKYNYKLCLKNKAERYAFTDDDTVLIDKNDWEYYYKVVEVQNEN